MEAVKAAQVLAAEGKRVQVINVVSLNTIQKPNARFVTEFLEEHVPVLTVHDAQAHALAHRVLEAQNVARRLGRQPGLLVKSLGADVSPLRTSVGSGTTEENYRRNHLDAAGIAQALREIVAN